MISRAFAGSARGQREGTGNKRRRDGAGGTAGKTRAVRYSSDCGRCSRYAAAFSTFFGGRRRIVWGDVPSFLRIRRPQGARVSQPARNVCRTLLFLARLTASTLIRTNWGKKRKLFRTRKRTL